MFAARIYFQQGVMIERKRTLPYPAGILVRRGQLVAAPDVVVEESFISGHQLFDVSRGLGVSKARADELVVCKVGSKVTAGDLLAGPLGITRRVIRATNSGKVVYIGDGNVLLEVVGTPTQLKAGMPGEVVDLIPEQGVILQTGGDLVQGVWGNNQIAEGELYGCLDSTDQALTVEVLNDLPPGIILTAGYCADPKVLKTAVEKSISGIILASLHPALIPLAAQLQVPVMILEGFGCHPVNPLAREIILANQGSHSALNSQPVNKLTNTRPELVIPHSVTQSPSKPALVELFAPGKKVRIINSCRLGRTGILIDLVGEQTLPSGMRAAAAKVQSGDQEEIVPLVNLEIVITE